MVDLKTLFFFYMSHVDFHVDSKIRKKYGLEQHPPNLGFLTIHDLFLEQRLSTYGLLNILDLISITFGVLSSKSSLRHLNVGNYGKKESNPEKNGPPEGNIHTKIAGNYGANYIWGVF